MCVAYEAGGVRHENLPYHQSVLHEAQPVYEELPGWLTDLSLATSLSDLPDAARRYVEFIAAQAGVPVRLVSVGPSRHQFVHVGG